MVNENIDIFNHLSIDTKLVTFKDSDDNKDGGIDTLINNLSVKDKIINNILNIALPIPKFKLSSSIQLIESCSGHLTLSFQDLDVYQVYDILEFWMDRIFELCKYYKSWKDDYLDQENVLSFFDDKIKNTIFEYCKLNDMILQLKIPSICNRIWKKNYLYLMISFIKKSMVS